jgi:Acetyltransferase (GNAT) family
VFVGLCYATLDGDHGNEWEIGGLTVPEDLRHLHLGTFLVRFALAHTIAWNRPWHCGQEVIAHVHEENTKPRNLLNRLGFVFVEKVEIPDHIAPASMKRNESGKVAGDKCRFPPSAVATLSNWFEHDFKGTLDDGKTPASFVILGGLKTLIEALQEAVTGLGY